MTSVLRCEIVSIHYLGAMSNTAPVAMPIRLAVISDVAE